MNNIPKGYKLVPVEPTEDMLAAEITPVLCLGNPETPRVEQWRRGLYAAMLAAAQTPSQDICTHPENCDSCSWCGFKRPPQPIYDEAAELENFSVHWKLEGRIYRDKNTKQWLPTRDSIEGFQMAERVHALWLGWEACAQSRAKAGEVGHE